MSLGAQAVLRADLIDPPHVAILFHRLGPYHCVRLRAAAERVRVTAVEFTNVDRVYAWDLLEKTSDFNWVTLFPGRELDRLRASQISSRVAEVLDQLRPSVVAIPGWYDRCSLAALQWCGEKEVSAVTMSESTAWDEKRAWWKEWAKRRLLKMCSAGLVGGRAHAAYLEQLGVEPKGIFLGYDVVDNDYFLTKAEEIREKKEEEKVKLQLPERFFLASARFVEKKNLSCLIRAYARYREMMGKAGAGRKREEIWDLVLLGDGPLKSDLSRLISDLGLESSVLLPGFKQYGELPAYYALAGAFVHASTTEQWGLVVNEAMAAGLPVLISNRCGCAGDLVQNGVNGFTFDPRDAAQLAELMERVSAAGFPLSELGWASRRIIEKWSPATFAEGLEAACQFALDKKNAGGSHRARGLAALLLYLPEIAYASRTEKTERALAVASVAGHLGSPTPVPNFFLIGAPKSGTTSMCEYLRGNPNICFSTIKEPHFFDLDTSRRLKLNLKTYLSLFSHFDPACHQAAGEGSTGYLFSKVAVAEIQKFNPHAKFVVMLRNPVELVQAWHSEMHFEGVENEGDFETAWRLERERRHGKKIPSSCWEPAKLFYSEWGKLGEQMERLFSVVARDRVKVVLFDRFVRDPRRAYEEVLAFLGVKSDGRTEYPMLHGNRKVQYPWLQQNLAALANHYRRVRAASGLRLSLGLGLFSRVLAVNSRPLCRRAISPVMLAELNNFYREDIKKLSGLLGQDLSFWISDARHPEILRR